MCLFSHSAYFNSGGRLGKGPLAPKAADCMEVNIYWPLLDTQVNLKGEQTRSSSCLADIFSLLSSIWTTEESVEVTLMWNI